MAEGRGRAEWTRTAHLLAQAANATRDPKKKPTPFQPDDFNPYALPLELPAKNKAAFETMRNLWAKPSS